MRFMIIPAALAALTTGALAQSNEEIRLMKAVFAQLQPLSFEKNREYCGYIGQDFDGKLIASSARKGTKDGCTPKDPKELAVIVASYHTHGAYLPGYASETPSVDDIEADESEGIDGWVATPGGRLWYIDTVDMEMSQICGLKCLPHDPNYDPEETGPIAQSYTYDELVEYFEE